MKQVGFVYIMANEYMPDLYKVGCTERAPHARADELSKHTGIPAPFVVLCYIEVEDFQAVERDFHKWLDSQRISNSREFFSGDVEWAIRLMYWHRGRLSFCKPERSPVVDEYIEPRDSIDWEFIKQPSADPWRPRDEPKSDGEPALKLVAQDDAGEGPA